MSAMSKVVAGADIQRKEIMQAGEEILLATGRSARLNGGKHLVYVLRRDLVSDRIIDGIRDRGRALAFGAQGLCQFHDLRRGSAAEFVV